VVGNERAEVLEQMAIARRDTAGTEDEAALFVVITTITGGVCRAIAGYRAAAAAGYSCILRRNYFIFLFGI